MDMRTDIHEVQAGILKALLLKEEARFSDLAAKGTPTDQLTFHVKRLVAGGVVEKMQGGLYRLTATGKEYASRFDIDSGPVKMEKQAKLGVLVVLTKGRGRAREYLMQTRLKQPFFGFRGFVTGKIKMGESVALTAARELLEESGLRAPLIHKAIYHERIFSRDGALLEDKYFSIFLGKEPTGDLIAEFPGGKNGWFKEKDVLRGNVFYDIKDLLVLANGRRFSFAEESYTVDRF